MELFSEELWSADQGPKHSSGDVPLGSLMFKQVLPKLRCSLICQPAQGNVTLGTIVLLLRELWWQKDVVHYVVKHLRRGWLSIHDGYELSWGMRNQRHLNRGQLWAPIAITSNNINWNDHEAEVLRFCLVLSSASHGLARPVVKALGPMLKWQS
jgi:hypothetical protein